MAAGFGNKRSSLRFSKKSPHRWVVFFRKTLYFQPRRPWKAPETKRPMRQEDAKKMSEKGATKRWRNENFPSVPGTANKFNSRLYDNKHQHNTDLVEITLRSRLNPHHFGGLVGIYGSLHGRWSHIGNCEVHLRHHHFHSFYGGTDWNIHLVINTLKYKRYEQKHWSDTYMGTLLHHQRRCKRTGKSSVSCPLKPSDSAPLKHSTMPP